MMTSLAETRTASVEQQVRAEQLRLLFAHGFLAFLVNGAAALLLCALIGPHIPRTDLIAWVSVFLAGWFLRGAMYFWRWRAPGSLSLDVWRNWFAIGTFVAGCSWGLVAVWLFPSSVNDRFFMAVVVMGLAAGAVASLSCVRGM